MNDQQRIDALNTIIAQWESIGWLKDVFQNVLAVREEIGQRDGKLKAIDAQCVAKEAALRDLEKAYHKKEAALEAALEQSRQALDKKHAALDQQAAEAEAQHRVKLEGLADQQHAAEVTLEKKHEDIKAAEGRLQKAEANMAEIKRQHEALKASLS